MEHLKPLLPAGGDASELEAAAQALAGLSPEDRDLLAAVQESPFRLTTLEQFREFPANTEYFILEPNIRKVEDVGWRYLAQHLDVLLPPELLDAIDPVPFGNHAMREEQGCFTSKGYLTLSGDEWEHERPRERQTDTPDKLRQMNNAFAELQEMGLVAASSSIYETVACGSIKSPNYLNAVVKIFTDTDHQELHNVLKTMEKAHGRTPESKLSGKIPLDIDIVVWNGEIIRPQDWKQDYFQTGLKELEQMT